MQRSEIQDSGAVAASGPALRSAVSRFHLRFNRKWWGLIFVLPVVAFFAVFNVFPVLFGFYLSLTEYDLLNPPEWVGLDNFSNLFGDKLFLTALKNTLI